MSEVIVVGYNHCDFAPSLVVGEIVWLDCEICLNQLEGLIFTSKNAVFALERNALRYPHMEQWKQIPSFVIGEGSAKVIRNLGGNLAYVSSKPYGEAFALEILEKIRDKKMLYLRGKEIATDLEAIFLQHKIAVNSQVIYQTRCYVLDSDQQRPSKGSILLFTSPSAYRFFLQNFAWDESYMAVALGKTTYRIFECGIQKFLSPFQDIKKSVFYLKSQYLIQTKS